MVRETKSKSTLELLQLVSKASTLEGFLVNNESDLVSLSTGEMKKRYGFVYVDMDDRGNGSLARIKKDSFYWVQDVTKSHGENLV